MQITQRVIDIKYGRLGSLRKTVGRPGFQSGPEARGRLMHPRHAYYQPRRRVVPSQIAATDPTGGRDSIAALLQGHIAEATVFVVGRAAGVRCIGQTAPSVLQRNLAVDVAA